VIARLPVFRPSEFISESGKSLFKDFGGIIISIGSTKGSNDRHMHTVCVFGQTRRAISLRQRPERFKVKLQKVLKLRYHPYQRRVYKSLFFTITNTTYVAMET